jgi:hypothetical protein
MFLNELLESMDAVNLVVTYPGRFQPFGLNHRAVYEKLQGRFGRDNVYVVTSGIVKADSPFNFSDRVKFMTAQGVAQDRIIQSNSPFTFPKQFEAQKNRTVFITAVGAPDADRLRVDTTYQEFKKNGQRNNIPAGKSVGDPTYYKTWEGPETAVTADQHGYVIIVPEQQVAVDLEEDAVNVSHGTDVRNTWNTIRNDPELRGAFLMQMFGRNDPELGHIMDKIPMAEQEEVEATRYPKLPKTLQAAGLK